MSVDGLDTRPDGGAVRRKVGFVFSDPDAQIVMPTVREDVEFSLRGRGLDRAELARRVAAALAAHGLAAHADHPAHLLSSGQKQALALASVLVLDPEILVCDEPTTLLDRRHTRRVADLLEALRAAGRPRHPRPRPGRRVGPGARRRRGPGRRRRTGGRVGALLRAAHGPCRAAGAEPASRAPCTGCRPEPSCSACSSSRRCSSRSARRGCCRRGRRRPGWYAVARLDRAGCGRSSARCAGSSSPSSPFQWLTAGWPVMVVVVGTLVVAVAAAGLVTATTTTTASSTRSSRRCDRCGRSGSTPSGSG